MRIAFAGTPPVAVPSLELLVQSAQHQVVAAITRPDAPAGRGRQNQPSAVATAADNLGLEVLKPGRPDDQLFSERLAQLDLDAIAVVAYGALVPESMLAIPKYGWINLHFSLLPTWRGAAPIQRAIEHGDEITGATTFQIIKELDAGPVFGYMTYQLPPRATSGEVLRTLALEAAPLLCSTLDAIADGSARPVEQAAGEATYAPKLTSQDAQIRFDRPAMAIDRLIRACTPAPGAWVQFRGSRLGLGPVSVIWADKDDAGSTNSAARTSGTAIAHDAAAPRVPSLLPGQLLATKRAVWVGTATTPVSLDTVTPAGKAPMEATAWARGQRLTEQDHF